jgi:protein gp37
MACNPNPKIGGKYRGLTEMRGTGKQRRPVFNGTIRVFPEVLTKPFHWRKPRGIFLPSMSDLFHPDVPSTFVDRVFATAALNPQHTFIICTKRAQRAHDYLGHEDRSHYINREIICHPLWENAILGEDPFPSWPLPNVWLLGSIENQKTADERVPWIARSKAVVRGLSVEPLLGPVDLLWPKSTNPNGPQYCCGGGFECGCQGRPVDMPDLYGINWVVAGGESGPRAGPMHPDWARKVRDDCAYLSVPFFFKQWGEWVTVGHPAFSEADPHGHRRMASFWPDGRFSETFPKEDDGQVCTIKRVGKKAAGRVLDGKVWEEFPTPGMMP